MATVAQGAMEHQEHHNAGSNKATQLVQMAAQHEDFKDVQLIDSDHPHLFAALLETWHQVNRQQQINMMNEPSITKFDRGNRATTADHHKMVIKTPMNQKCYAPAAFATDTTSRKAASAEWELKLRTYSNAQHKQNRHGKLQDGSKSGYYQENADTIPRRISGCGNGQCGNA
jgi:hypothetical protein